MSSRLTDCRLYLIPDLFSRRIAEHLSFYRCYPALPPIRREPIQNITLSAFPTQLNPDIPYVALGIEHMPDPLYFLRLRYEGASSAFRETRFDSENVTTSIPVG